MTEIVIPFGAKALDKAKATIKEMAAALKEAAKGIKDVEARKAFLKEAKAAVSERKAELLKDARGVASIEKLEQARRGSLGAGLGAQQAVIDKAAAAAVTRVLGFGQKIGGLSGGLVSLLQGDQDKFSKGLQLGLHVLAASNVPIVSQVASIVSQVVSILDAKAEKERAAQDRRFREALKVSLAEADTSRRYEQDVQFRRRQNVKAQDEVIARTARGWEPRGSRLMDGDF